MQAGTPAVDEDVDPPKRKATTDCYFVFFVFFVVKYSSADFVRDPRRGFGFVAVRVRRKRRLPLGFSDAERSPDGRGRDERPDLRRGQTGQFFYAKRAPVVSVFCTGVVVK